MTSAFELGNIVGVGCAAAISMECLFHINLNESIVGDLGNGDIIIIIYYYTILTINLSITRM